MARGDKRRYIVIAAMLTLTVVLFSYTCAITHVLLPKIGGGNMACMSHGSFAAHPACKGAPSCAGDVSSMSANHALDGSSAYTLVPLMLFALLLLRYAGAFLPRTYGQGRGAIHPEYFFEVAFSLPLAGGFSSLRF